MKCRIRTLLPLSAVVLSLTFVSTGAHAASASALTTTEQATAETAAADVELIATLDTATRASIEKDLRAMGQSSLPSRAVAIGFNPAGDAVAVDADGAETVLESAASMDAQIATSGLNVNTAAAAGSNPGSPRMAASGEKGALSGIAASIAGCAGGVIGFDAIMGILEKRVS